MISILFALFNLCSMILEVCAVCAMVVVHSKSSRLTSEYLQCERAFIPERPKGRLWISTFRKYVVTQKYKHLPYLPKLKFFNYYQIHYRNLKKMI